MNISKKFTDIYGQYKVSTDHHHHHHHRHIPFMELDHLLTRSVLTYLEVSSKVFHGSFCQLGSNAV